MLLQSHDDAIELLPRCQKRGLKAWRWPRERRAARSP